MSKSELLHQVRVLCKEARDEDRVDGVSYTTLQTDLINRFDHSKKDLKPFKQDIKDLATELLAAFGDDVPSAQHQSSSKPRSDQEEDLGASPSPKKRSKKAVVPASDEDDSAEEAHRIEPRKEKQKQQKRKAAAVAKPSGGHLSKEFIDSEGNPVSTGPGALSDEEVVPVPPKKKTKQSSTSAQTEPKLKTKGAAKEEKPKAAKKGADLSPNEAEIERLKGFIKACGVRFMHKEIEDKTEKQAIKHLKDKLADLGMPGRLSMAKAKEIKDQRDLAKELSEIQETLPKGSRNAVEPNSGRGSRRSLASSASAPAAKKFKRPIVVDDDDEDEDDGDEDADQGQRQVDTDEEDEEEEQDEDSEEERRQSKLDKQAGKKVKQFAKIMKGGRF